MHRRELSIEEREIIINCHKQGKSYNDISEIVGRSKSTVQKVVNRYENEGRVKNKPRSGRPGKLSAKEKRAIVSIIKKNPFERATKIALDLEHSFQKKVCAETVRRTIKKAGYHSRVARKKPLVNERNRKKRLEFAKMYVNKETSFWDDVIFSDESKYNIFGSDGRHRLWRKPGDELNPKNTCKTVKHGGGSVMVWGCMSSAGVGNLVIIDDIMNKEVYLNILKSNLLQSAEKLGIADRFYFQQDNDPKHTAGIVKMWIIYNTPHVLQTPPQSPDHNPIEHLWDYLEKQIRKVEIRNKSDLKAALVQEWEKISPELTRKLVHSMPDRLKATIKLKGNPTKY